VVALTPLAEDTYDPQQMYPYRDVPPRPAVGRPPREDELLHKALSFVELKQHQKALQAFNRAIKRHPTNGRAWLEKGLLLMNAFRRFAEALEALEEAWRLGEPGAEEQIMVCRKRIP
jgi:tetratricopeptide (TPR) repeat protein